jgi:NOL1/NOP2/fmu family ribosome biogenesis protein
VERVRTGEWQTMQEQQRMVQLYGRPAILRRARAFMAGENDLTYDRTTGRCSYRMDYEIGRRILHVGINAAEAAAISGAVTVLSGGSGALIAPAIIGSSIGRSVAQAWRGFSGVERGMREELLVARNRYYEKACELADRVGPEEIPQSAILDAEQAYRDANNQADPPENIATEAVERYRRERNQAIKDLVNFVYSSEQNGVVVRRNAEGRPFNDDEQFGEPLEPGDRSQGEPIPGGQSGPALVRGTEVYQPSDLAPTAETLDGMEKNLQAYKTKWEWIENGLSLAGGLGAAARGIIVGKMHEKAFEVMANKLASGEAVKLDIDGNWIRHAVQATHAGFHSLNDLAAHANFLYNSTMEAMMAAAHGDTVVNGAHALGETGLRLGSAISKEAWRQVAVAAGNALSGVVINSIWRGATTKMAQGNFDKQRDLMKTKHEVLRRGLQPESREAELQTEARNRLKTYPEVGQEWIYEDDDGLWHTIEITEMINDPDQPLIRIREFNSDRGYNIIRLMTVEDLLNRESNQIDRGNRTGTQPVRPEDDTVPLDPDDDGIDHGGDDVVEPGDDDDLIDDDDSDVTPGPDDTLVPPPAPGVDDVEPNNTGGGPAGTAEGTGENPNRGSEQLTNEETEEILSRLQISNNEINGRRLDIEMIERYDLVPRFRLEFEGREMWVSSNQFNFDGRLAGLAYIREGDNYRLSPYMMSSSQGTFRFYPGFQVGESGGREDIIWYSKGNGEHSLALPIEMQEQLSGLSQSSVRVEYDDALVVLIGSSNRYNTYGDAVVSGGEFSGVERTPELIPGVPGEDLNDATNPENLVLSAEDEPDFSNVVSEWRSNNVTYGEVTYNVYLSRNGNYRYMFCRDQKDRAWLSQVEIVGSEVNERGLRRRWLNTGALTTPAFEYPDRLGQYANNTVQSGEYVDGYDKFISKIPVVRQFQASLVEGAGGNPDDGKEVKEDKGIETVRFSEETWASADLVCEPFVGENVDLARVSPDQVRAFHEWAKATMEKAKPSLLRVREGSAHRVVDGEYIEFWIPRRPDDNYSVTFELNPTEKIANVLIKNNVGKKLIASWVEGGDETYYFQNGEWHKYGETAGDEDNFRALPPAVELKGLPPARAAEGVDPALVNGANERLARDGIGIKTDETKALPEARELQDPNPALTRDANDRLAEEGVRIGKDKDEAKALPPSREEEHKALPEASVTSDRLAREDLRNLSKDEKALPETSDQSEVNKPAWNYKEGAVSFEYGDKEITVEPGQKWSWRTEFEDQDHVKYTIDSMDQTEYGQLQIKFVGFDPITRPMDEWRSIFEAGQEVIHSDNFPEYRFKGSDIIIKPRDTWSFDIDGKTSLRNIEKISSAGEDGHLRIKFENQEAKVRPEAEWRQIFEPATLVKQY